VHGLDPPDHLFRPLTEFRCAAQAIRNALEAERAGYDGFVVGHFQEPGLLEIHGTLDIPVVRTVVKAAANYAQNRLTLANSA
jgi:allantoin racemase